MAGDTVVTMDDIPVMYVDGEKGRPIAEQAPAAFEKLEAELPSLKGRKFYGVQSDGLYRACVALNETDDPSVLPHPAWVIPGGRYARRKIRDWEQHIDQIVQAFNDLHRDNEVDPARPNIEYYRSQRELFCLVPIK